MIVTAKKWGNGVGLYFPNSAVDENREFELTMTPNGDIHLKRKLTIEEMIESIDVENMRNDETFKAFSAMEPVGREIW